MYEIHFSNKLTQRAIELDFQTLYNISDQRGESDNKEVTL